MGGTTGVFAGFADGLESDQIQLLLLGLIIACGVGMIVVLRTVQKVTTRLLSLVLLLAVGLGLWVQHDQLQDCRAQCTCRLFGRDVQVPDIAADAGVCPD